jgi:hypothetical protein
MNRKKLIQFFITVASLGATAAINYSIFHSSFIFVVLAVLLAHELAHYFVARMHSGNPDLPYFIPFPLISIGITRIKNMRHLSFNSKKKILFYGPFAGFVCSLLFSILSLIFIPSYFLPLLILSISEIVFNYFGMDGKKYRKYSYEENLSYL